MNKKAQVQFMEMIFVLLILVIIIFIGMIIYYSFLNKGLKEKSERFTEIDSIILTDSVASMAELTHETGVINSVKLFSLADILTSTDSASEKYREYYRSFFGNDKKVTLEIIYPKPSGPRSNDNLDCTAEDPARNFNTNYVIDDNCKFFTIYNPVINQARKSGSEIRKNPVSVYYPLTNQYKIGILTVEVYKFD